MRVTTTQRPKEEIERELDEAERQARKALLARENIYVGLMFGSKALVQLLTNPWIGPLTNK
jgi:DHA1 family solute carrier family 18 vesicular amine transporter 1/2